MSSKISLEYLLNSTKEDLILRNITSVYTDLYEDTEHGTTESLCIAIY